MPLPPLAAATIARSYAEQLRPQLADVLRDNKFDTEPAGRALAVLGLLAAFVVDSDPEKPAPPAWQRCMWHAQLYRAHAMALPVLEESIELGRLGSVLADLATDAETDGDGPAHWYDEAHKALNALLDSPALDTAQAARAAYRTFFEAIGDPNTLNAWIHGVRAMGAQFGSQLAGSEQPWYRVADAAAAFGKLVVADVTGKQGGVLQAQTVLMPRNGQDMRGPKR